jgi:hypothetical protein
MTRVAVVGPRVDGGFVRRMEAAEDSALGCSNAMSFGPRDSRKGKVTGSEETSRKRVHGALG